MGITEFGMGRIAEKKAMVFRQQDGLRVIDIGGGKEKHLSDKFEKIEAVADILPKPDGLHENLVWFSGDINMPEVWEEILEYVERNGKFDFAICTHTLEDLRNPLLTALRLPRVAERGLVTVPSIHAESRRFELFRSYRGWRHHRWVHLLENGPEGPTVLAMPKVGAFELWPVGQLKRRDPEKQELWFLWQEDFSYELFRGDHLGPDDWDFTEQYLKKLVGSTTRLFQILKRLSRNSATLADAVRKIPGQLLRRRGQIDLRERFRIARRH